jgi:biotin carboxylase
MKRLLIIGAGHEQVGAILMARDMGVEVIATDINPSAPGMGLAHHCRVVSTDNAAGNLEVANAFQIDGVITLSSETAVPVVAHIAEALGLPGYSSETAYWATNKNAMRERFALFDVPTPASQRISSLAQAQAFAHSHSGPIVLKPSDCSGQRGTHFVEHHEHLADALADALKYSGDGQAIVEVFHSGPEINVTAAVQNGVIHWLSFSDRITAESPHFGIALEHRMPSRVGPQAEESIRQASERAIRSVGLRDGIAYPQVLWTAEGPKVLEIAVRIPGGHMADVAMHTGGIDMVEFTIRQALGESDPYGACKRHPRQKALSVRFMTSLDVPDTEHQITAIQGFKEAAEVPGVEWVSCHIQPGGRIPALAHSGGRFGAVLAFADTSSQAGARSLAAVQKIKFEFNPVNDPLT